MSLFTTTVNPESVREDRCPICLTDDTIAVAASGKRWVVVKSDKEAIVTRCGHAFHQQCLDDWHNASNTANRKCFICQKASCLDDIESDSLENHPKGLKKLRNHCILIAVTIVQLAPMAYFAYVAFTSPSPPLNGLDFIMY